jgi:predicted aspartyl protease
VSRGRESHCLAIIDTGATLTSIPERTLEMLGARVVGLVPVTDFRGVELQIPVFRVHVRIKGQWENDLIGEFDLKVWATRRKDAAIGWDVLGNFEVSLRLAKPQ